MQRRACARLELEDRMLLAAHRPSVDDRDRNAAIDGAQQEAVPGVDGKRRADDEKKLRHLHRGERFVDGRTRNVVAEEDDPWLEDATTQRAGRDFEALDAIRAYL